MSTYTQTLYQIVFSTKYREKSLSKNNRIILFKYMSGLLSNKKCHVYRINGIEDHLHIITHIHPSIALSSLVRAIKVSSALFIKEQKLFSHFHSWQDGYGAFTYGIQDKDRLIEYVINQESHHKTKSFKEEYLDLLNEHGIVLDEKYFL